MVGMDSFKDNSLGMEVAKVLYPVQRVIYMYNSVEAKFVKTLFKRDFSKCPGKVIFASQVYYSRLL